MKFVTFLGASAVIASSLVATSCASVLSGSTQPVNVAAVNSKSQRMLNDANCTIRDAKGNVYPVVGNPGQAVIGRGNGPLTVRCTSPGYAQSRVGVAQDFNAVSAVNILWLPGFLVDAYTGALQKYPSSVTVEMSPMRHHRAH